MAKHLAQEDWKTAQTAIAEVLLDHDVHIAQEQPFGSNRIDIFGIQKVNENLTIYFCLELKHYSNFRAYQETASLEQLYRYLNAVWLDLKNRHNEKYLTNAWVIGGVVLTLDYNTNWRSCKSPPLKYLTNDPLIFKSPWKNRTKVFVTKYRNLATQLDLAGLKMAKQSQLDDFF
jgi:hypothetical protein